jgi:hypothetical protein
MKHFLRVGLLCALAVSAGGCSGDHGFLGTNYNPKGDITITNAANGAVLATSATGPYVDLLPGFSIGIAETNFSGPYTVQMIGWNNGFNIPCFVPHSIDTTDHVNVELLSADNANPPTDPPTQANPCVSNGTDMETALISDGKGNSVKFYFVFGP